MQKISKLFRVLIPMCFLLLPSCGSGAGEGGEEVSNGPVSITAVTPTSGGCGTWVTLEGTGFTSKTNVNVGGAMCTATTFVSPTQLRCRVGRHEETLLAVSAKNGEGEQAILRDAFTYKAFLFVANSQERTILSVVLPSEKNAAWTEGEKFSSDALAPAQIAADPLGRFLFVISQSTASEKVIYTYPINSERGSLLPAVKTEMTELPLHLVPDPSGKFLAVSANPSGGSKANLVIYAISEDGSLNLVSQQEGLTGRRTVFSPDRRFLYQSVASMTHSLLPKLFNAETGQVDKVGFEIPEVSRALALAMDPAGKFLFAVTDFNTRLQNFQRDEQGAIIPVASMNLPGGNGEKFLVTHPKRNLLYTLTAGLPQCQVFSWQPETGKLSARKVDCESGNSATEMAFDATGNWAFISNADENHVKVFQIDPATGALLPSETLQSGGGASGLAVD